MDSITHTLFKAIWADDAHQHQMELHHARRPDEGVVGLQPLSKRKEVHEAYEGAAGSDLHIELARGEETLALYMEFVAAGYCPPVSLVDGATVILAPGQIELYALTDKGDMTWCARLAASSRPSDRPGAVSFTQRKAGWTEQVS